MADTTNPEIEQTIADVISDKVPTTWCAIPPFFFF